jgi:hypothetical protein
MTQLLRSLERAGMGRNGQEGITGLQMGGHKEQRAGNVCTGSIAQGQPHGQHHFHGQRIFASVALPVKSALKSTLKSTRSYHPPLNPTATPRPPLNPTLNPVIKSPKIGRFSAVKPQKHLFFGTDSLDGPPHLQASILSSKTGRRPILY